MRQQFVRLPPPVKGWNTLSPIREMNLSYSPLLENVWFDQAGGINRRPAQHLLENYILSVGYSQTNLIKRLGQHIGPNKATTLFAVSFRNGNYYIDRYNNTLTARTAEGMAVATKLGRFGAIGTQLVYGTDESPTYVKYFNGTSWANCTGAQPMNIFCPYKGRMYGAGDPQNAMTLYFSDTIGGTGVGVADWTPGVAGGMLDISEVAPGGQYITGLATYLGNLVIFCRNAIVIYSIGDPTDIMTISLQKVINGIGCLNHDTIQGIGNDIIFLSDFGFKLLSEILVRGDAAAEDASIPINNHVVNRINTNPALAESAQSCFASKYGVYLCTMGNETYCYHVLFKSWSKWIGINPVLFTSYDGRVLTANDYLCELRDTEYQDSLTYDAAQNIVSYSIPMSVEFAPVKIPESRRARFVRAEIMFESEATDTVTLETWPDLDRTQTLAQRVDLAPNMPITTSDTLYWATGPATNNPFQKWATAGGNSPTWLGIANFYAGEKKVPIYGIGELLSCRILNDSKTRFKIIGMDVYFNVGSMR